jgi:hypothetical protein
VDWFVTTVAIYRRSLARGGELALRNWPVLGTVFLYFFIFSMGAHFAFFLGRLGGFLLSVVMAFCVGSFLYLVEMIVQTNRVTLEDLRRSFGAYLGEVIGVMFTLWIISVALSAFAVSPNGRLIIFFINIVLWIFLNAVPELIYLGHYSIGELLAESYRFIGENWIEWFPINFVLLGIFLFLWNQPANNFLMTVVTTGIAALFLYFVMVVRGLLFLELHRSNRRARIFRHRAGS